MKKIVSVIAFAFVMMFSAQNVSAQNLKQDQERPEVVAKSQVAELTKQLDLTGDQSRTLYRALVSKEINYRKLVNDKDVKNAEVMANKSKIDNAFMSSLKTTLTKEQYSKWLSTLPQ